MVTIPAGASVRGFATLSIDNHDGNPPVPQSALPEGQVFSVESADSADFTVVKDDPAIQPDADPTTGVVPPTVGSFLVTAPASPSQPNVPVNVTLHVNKADGTPAATPKVDQIVISEEATEIIGDLFGAPVLPAPPA